MSKRIKVVEIWPKVMGSSTLIVAVKPTIPSTVLSPWRDIAFKVQDMRLWTHYNSGYVHE